MSKNSGFDKMEHVDALDQEKEADATHRALAAMAMPKLIAPPAVPAVPKMPAMPAVPHVPAAPHPAFAGIMGAIHPPKMPKAPKPLKIR